MTLFRLAAKAAIPAAAALFVVHPAAFSAVAGAATSVGAPAPVTVTAQSAVPSGSALATLSRLSVKGPAPMTGYSRAQFGPAWADVDHNGCDTRNDILRRDLTSKTFRAGTHGCIVATGILHEPYTGRTIAFRRGPVTSLAVQIDHVVPLADAWKHGAQSWTPDKRLHYANDPLELLAVDGPANEAKGDSNAASWLPPNKAFRCAYVARMIAVKAKYGLSVTGAERDAMRRVLSTCPTQTLPRG